MVRHGCVLVAKAIEIEENRTVQYVAEDRQNSSVFGARIAKKKLTIGTIEPDSLSCQKKGFQW